MTEHLEKLEINGNWTLQLFKQVSENYHGNIKFINIYKTGELYALAKYAIKPCGKGSNWRIGLFPHQPNGQEKDKILTELLRKEKGNAEVETETEEIKQEPPDVCINHVKSAKITQEAGSQVRTELER